MGCLKSTSRFGFRAPLIFFRAKFSNVVRGGGQAEEPRLLFPPPPPSTEALCQTPSNATPWPAHPPCCVAQDQDDSEGDEEFVVEKVLEHRKTKDGMQYFVKWQVCVAVGEGCASAGAPPQPPNGRRQTRDFLGLRAV